MVFTDVVVQYITTDLVLFDRYWEMVHKATGSAGKTELIEKLVRIYKGHVLNQAAGEHWLLNTASQYNRHR